MRLGRSQADKLAADLAGLEAKREALDADLGAAGTRLAEAATAARAAEELAAAAYLGEADPREASRAAEDAASAAARARAEHARLQRVAPLLDERIETKREELRLARRDDAIGRLKQALGEQRKASAGFAGAASPASLETLLAARRTVDEADALVAEFTEDEPAPDLDRDEPDWPESAALARVAKALTDGPRKPSAVEAQAERESRAAGERLIAEAVRQVTSLPSGAWAGLDYDEVRDQIVSQLPERLRGEALRRIDVIEEAQASRAARRTSLGGDGARFERLRRP